MFVKDLRRALLQRQYLCMSEGDTIPGDTQPVCEIAVIMYLYWPWRHTDLPEHAAQYIQCQMMPKRRVTAWVVRVWLIADSSNPAEAANVLTQVLQSSEADPGCTNSDQQSLHLAAWRLARTSQACTAAWCCLRHSSRLCHCGRRSRALSPPSPVIEGSVRLFHIRQKHSSSNAAFMQGHGDEIQLQRLTILCERSGQVDIQEDLNGRRPKLGAHQTFADCLSTLQHSETCRCLASRHATFMAMCYDTREHFCSPNYCKAPHFITQHRAQECIWHCKASRLCAIMDPRRAHVDDVRQLAGVALHGDAGDRWDRIVRRWGNISRGVLAWSLGSS